MLVDRDACCSPPPPPKRASSGCASNGARSCSTAAPFGAAGPYEKLVGKVDFGLDPDASRATTIIVDLKLAPRNARGEVESSADFYMLKPVDPRRGNGRLFYEVGNRGGKSMLVDVPEGRRLAGSDDRRRSSATAR